MKPSPIFCTHANECVVFCPCGADCYCRAVGNTRAARGRSEGCLMERFFADQQKLPPSRRSTGALLVCTCPKCLARRGHL
jgi:hypothetical protein